MLTRADGSRYSVATKRLDARTYLLDIGPHLLSGAPPTQGTHVMEEAGQDREPYWTPLMRDQDQAII